MNIFDLNHIEAVEGTEVLGGGYYYSQPDFKFEKKVDTDVKNRLDVFKDVYSKAVVKGNLADAEAFADAYGDDSFSETLTVTYADSYNSQSYSDSKSAAN
ncbi:hypothetical protein IQ247_10855 [Plectonema cf. radiosum LEGE 06105]|uniref:Uncharacterized protein n=1 Tax=Plectonema cf. radiosum LEGE 06105 TaxID=945769 RepID=A0A8J7F1U5_9CYAN|nr:hypothetical protein [Plectonema radiosum]MBE9213165.1 hypothetical protein [Plectonema cf. radiosum LEGE 06105]